MWNLKGLTTNVKEETSKAIEEVNSMIGDYLIS